MKKLTLAIVLGLSVFFSCSKQIEEPAASESTASAQTILLSTSEVNGASLQLKLKGNNLKATAAESFASEAEPGDTLYWSLAPFSNILKITDIIIVQSDCESLFDGELYFNADSSTCYAVISQEAYGNSKYNIAFKHISGKTFEVDPIIVIPPIESTTDDDEKESVID